MNKAQTLEVALLVSLAACAMPTDALACTVSPNGWTSSPLQGLPDSEAVTPIPANGSLVLHYVCLTDGQPSPSSEEECTKEPPTDIVVTDKASGQRVAGAITASGIEPSWFAWTPDSPFAEGHLFNVEIDGNLWDLTLEAVSAVDAGEPPAAAVSVAATQRNLGDYRHCEEALIGVCGEDTYYTDIERRAALFFEWDEVSEAEVAQFLVRVRWNGSSEPGFTPLTFFTRSFAARQNEYCYHLEYKSLIDGSEFVDPEVCLPHGDAGEVGIFEPDIASFLQWCTVPPAADQEKWCELMRDECSDAAESGDPEEVDYRCVNARATCASDAGVPTDGGATPEPRDGGATSAPSDGGDANASEMDGDSGSEAPDSGDMFDHDAFDPRSCGIDSEGGCSVSRLSSSSSSWLSLGIALVGLALRLRRQRG